MCMCEFKEMTLYRWLKNDTLYVQRQESLAEIKDKSPEKTYLALNNRKQFFFFFSFQRFRTKVKHF